MNIEIFFVIQIAIFCYRPRRGYTPVSIFYNYGGIWTLKVYGVYHRIPSTSSLLTRFATKQTVWLVIHIYYHQQQPFSFHCWILVVARIFYCFPSSALSKLTVVIFLISSLEIVFSVVSGIPVHGVCTTTIVLFSCNVRNRFHFNYLIFSMVSNISYDFLSSLFVFTSSSYV